MEFSKHSMEMNKPEGRMERPYNTLESGRPMETAEQPWYNKWEAEDARSRSGEFDRPVERGPESRFSTEVLKNGGEVSSERLPRTGGHWEGEAGESRWIPDKNLEPGDRNGTNPEHKTWGEILEEHGVESVPFRNGEVDFSDISKGKVEIDDFSADRSSNFDQADEKLAEQRGCTPEDVAKWRSENGYTWHECRDCKTMLAVPTEIHGNIPHSGGISEYKAQKQ